MIDAAIPAEHGIVLAGILFLIGLVGVLARRDVLFVLFSVEIMLNAAGLASICAGSLQRQAEGQILFLFILAAAAAEVAIGLSLVLWFYHQRRTLDIDRASAMKG